MRRVAVAVALVAACGDPPSTFECPGTPSCRDGAALGICEETGFCSFPDQACPTGRRYGGVASDALADQCVDLGPEPLGSWTAGLTLPSPRYTLATTVLDNRFYAIGGIAGSTPFADVWSSDITGGTLRAWVQTTSLPDNLRNMDAAGYDGHIYVVGGRHESGPAIQDVLVATANPDGSVGPWTATTPLPGALRCHEVVQWEDHLFVVGGKTNGNTGVADVLVGDMDGGAIAGWRLAGSFEGGRQCFGAATVDGFLYVFGGCSMGSGSCITNGNTLADVQVARINDDGTLAPFAYTTPLPSAVWHHTATAGNHHVFVLGGDWVDGSTASTVMVNHVNTDGSLGAWRRTGDLTSGFRRWRAEVNAGFVFIVGSGSSLAPLR